MIVPPGMTALSAGIVERAKEAITATIEPFVREIVERRGEMVDLPVTEAIAVQGATMLILSGAVAKVAAANAKDTDHLAIGLTVISEMTTVMAGAYYADRRGAVVEN